MITRVTDNHTVDRNPAVSGAHVAWLELVGDEIQVFVYEATNGLTKRLRYRDATSNRELSGQSNNLVAWIGDLPEMVGLTSSFLNVYLYDLDHRSGRNSCREGSRPECFSCSSTPPFEKTGILLGLGRPSAKTM